jgi:photoactive yellow protein
MADLSDASYDVAWYRAQWEELMELLSASDPEEVVPQVRELQLNLLDEAEALDELGLTDTEQAQKVLRRIFQRLQTLRRKNQTAQRIVDAVGADSLEAAAASVAALQDRVEDLESQREALAEAGFDRAEQVVHAIESMEAQLDELYDEKQATERSDATLPDVTQQGDTFEQLQALLAREEKLQRKLGVSNADDVIEMVEGLSEQLTELYEGQEQLAAVNVNGAQNAAEMVKSMQHQLESLYERQETLSERGIDGMGEAITMIESMEAQLNALYDDRYRLAEAGVDSGSEALSRIRDLEARLDALADEHDSVLERRDALQSKLDALEAQLGMNDPDAISSLIESMEDQLREAYDEPDPAPGTVEGSPLLSESTRSRLESLDADALNDLPVGAFQLDAEGTVLRANEAALRWPALSADSADTIEGRSFFEEVAPGTDTPLFRGRMDAGLPGESVDDAFVYTYVPDTGAPTNLVVHLYRDEDAPTTWVLFRPA